MEEFENIPERMRVKLFKVGLPADTHKTQCVLELN